MKDRICLKCNEVFCSGEATYLEGKDLFMKHQ
jgi:hypothetical protein